MKGKIKYIIILLLVVILIFIYNIYNTYILNYYSSKYFSLDYDKNWYIVEKSSNNIVLNNKNGSSVDIICRDILDNKKDIDDIYYDFEEDFRVSNKFNLIKYGKTNIGRDYIDGYEYLYKYNNYQILLILVKYKDYMYEISYSSYDNNFDLNIQDFYDIINSVKFY